MKAADIKVGVEYALRGGPTQTPVFGTVLFVSEDKAIKVRWAITHSERWRPTLPDRPDVQVQNLETTRGQRYVIVDHGEAEGWNRYRAWACSKVLGPAEEIRPQVEAEQAAARAEAEAVESRHAEMKRDIEWCNGRLAELGLGTVDRYGWRLTIDPADLKILLGRGL